MKEKLYFYKFIDVKVIFINIYNSRKAGNRDAIKKDKGTD